MKNKKKTTGGIVRFVRKVRRRMTCLYGPPYGPLLRRGPRGTVKTSPTPAPNGTATASATTPPTSSLPRGGRGE